MMKSVFFLMISFMLSSFESTQKPRFVFVAAGNFEMGCVDAAFPDEGPVHMVSVDSFYICKNEVLYEDYLAFCRYAGNPDPEGTAGFPATNLTWENAVMYCNWLSGMEGMEQCYTLTREKDRFSVVCDFKKNGYRLPTEAEWEYAARGGVRNKSFKYSGSNDPFKIGWFSENSKNTAQKSGQLEPNELGLYDMSGNVAEWCWDYYDKSYYSKSPKQDPTGPDKGTSRVYRGGSRKNKLGDLENAKRFSLDQIQKDMYVGFRLVRTRLN